MRVSDLIVIYFSIGAPVAVYSYFQTRAQSNGEKIWRQSVFTFLFWIPAALRILSKSDFFQSVFFPNRASETLPLREGEVDLRLLQKRFEKILLESDCGFSIFEFRETIERYIGLTLAARIENGAAGEEFFLAAQNKSVELAAKCLDRRNRRRLLFHQTAARGDFLQILARMFGVVSNRTELGNLAVELAAVLKDCEARKAIEKIFFTAPTGGESLPVKILEKDLWKPEASCRPQRQTAVN